MSEYENVVQGTVKRGRKPLSLEEKQGRIQIQKQQIWKRNRLRGKADQHIWAHRMDKCRHEVQCGLVQLHLASQKFVADH